MAATFTLQCWTRQEGRGRSGRQAEWWLGRPSSWGFSFCLTNKVRLPLRLLSGFCKSPESPLSASCSLAADVLLVKGKEGGAQSFKGFLGSWGKQKFFLTIKLLDCQTVGVILNGHLTFYTSGLTDCSIAGLLTCWTVGWLDFGNFNCWIVRLKGYWTVHWWWWLPEWVTVGWHDCWTSGGWLKFLDCWTVAVVFCELIIPDITSFLRRKWHSLLFSFSTLSFLSYPHCRSFSFHFSFFFSFYSQFSLFIILFFSPFSSACASCRCVSFLSPAFHSYSHSFLRSFFFVSSLSSLL